MNKTFKRIMISGLTLAMVLGGATSAFADGKGKAKGHYKAKDVDIKLKGKGDVHITLLFKDLKGGDVEWAINHILRLADKGVFVGYQDGTFRPRQQITRIEAITAAVRLLGLEEEAKAEMDTQLNFKDAEKIEKKYPWAVGYVAVAAENDLFLETDDMVNPEKPADRLWATTLLVKALKLEDEAKAKMNTKLTFKDARQIPAGSVGYVAVAVEKGLISGYDDNTFRPNRPVTRAELAALLDRTDGRIPDQQRTVVKGTVEEVTSSSIKVEKEDDQTQTLSFADNAVIYRDGKKVSATDIKKGDEVLIHVVGGKAVFVRVTEKAEQNEFSVVGLFNSMTLDANGRIATISITHTVNNNTQVSIYNVSRDVKIVGNQSELTLNKVIELKGKDQVVTQIEIK